mmetsp:Transcript_61620/g.165562  ORF Transcript_61620/g.165562 Transcript_61620/m.165562 type:complete len:300 (-) Transcript_61620:190-1089(-)
MVENKHRSFWLGLGALCALTIFSVVVVTEIRRSKRTVLGDWSAGYKWEAPYPGAGPPTPKWESNVLGGNYKYPDYARSGRNTGMKTQQLPLVQYQHSRPVAQLWVGSPQKMLPPDGDYPGGSTGIPEDGYIAYETGYMNDGPFHGELAPMQEAGIASAVRVALPRGRMLSILDPGNQIAPFNDFDLGNFGAPLDRSYRPEVWDNPDTQPLDWINAGTLTCVIGQDCHDRTHQVDLICVLTCQIFILLDVLQGGLHDNGNQYYDNFFTGSIDPNSDKSVNPEYARQKQNRIRRAFAAKKV